MLLSPVQFFKRICRKATQLLWEPHADVLPPAVIAERVERLKRIEGTVWRLLRQPLSDADRERFMKAGTFLPLVPGPKRTDAAGQAKEKIH
jgi:hypothetical protein